MRGMKGSDNLFWAGKALAYVNPPEGKGKPSREEKHYQRDPCRFSWIVIALQLKCLGQLFTAKIQEYLHIYVSLAIVCTPKESRTKMLKINIENVPFIHDNFLSWPINFNLNFHSISLIYLHQLLPFSWLKHLTRFLWFSCIIWIKLYSGLIHKLTNFWNFHPHNWKHAETHSIAVAAWCSFCMESLNCGCFLARPYKYLHDFW